MENEADLADDEASGEEKTTKEKEKKEEKEKGKGKKQDDSGARIDEFGFTTAPTIELLGRNRLVVRQGDLYLDEPFFSRKISPIELEVLWQVLETLCKGKTGRLTLCVR